MNKKSLLMVVGIGSVIFIVILYNKIVPYTDRVMRIGGETFFIEERTDSNGWQKGLSGRKSICGRCGMLFVFPDEKTRGFWMKDMRFDIDIIWINGDKIVHIEKNVSHKTPEKTYHPQQKATTVLELPAGKVEKLELIVGDMIEW